MWWLALAALLALATASCNSCEPGEAPAPATSAAAIADAGSQKTAPRAVQFSASDGARLAGDFYPAPEARSPVVVLIHRPGADRAEWKPLIARLQAARRRYAILSFDLRGHGQSAAGPAEAGAAADAAEPWGRDVRAAMQRAVEEATAPRIVLVGSSLGATLAARLAFAEPLVSALALISPGAALEGVDLYRAYAEVRNLPTFIAAAKDDTVAKDPLQALSKMAMMGTSRTYDGEVHGAGFLGERHAEFWQDLEAWLMSVHDETPRERRSLYYAEGREPDGSSKATKQRTRTHSEPSGRGRKQE
jgi:pimeloyl-ACP methyl ester carboxylesterase